MIKEGSYTGSAGRKAAYAIHYPTSEFDTVILFVHGYMGFKDWGAWGLVSEFFSEKGIAFCRMNLSHNGVTIDNPTEFADLEAFALNRYSYERFDVGEMISVLKSEDAAQRKLILVGHSRGGGIVSLFADDERVAGIVSWAGIASIFKRFEDEEVIYAWRKNGVRYVTNQRTGQEMPHAYIQVEDVHEHKELLAVDRCLTQRMCPFLAIHGTEDTSVLPEEAFQLAEYSKTEAVFIEGANHTFGASHPWNDKVLPEHLKILCEMTEKFIRP